MKNIKFKLSNSDNATEVFKYLKSFVEFRKYVIVINQSNVEILNIPDNEISVVTDFISNFFNIGIVTTPTEQDLENEQYIELIQPFIDTEANSKLKVLINKLMDVDPNRYLDMCIKDVDAYTNNSVIRFSIGNIVELASASDFFYEITTSSPVLALVCNIVDTNQVYICPVISHIDNHLKCIFIDESDIIEGSNELTTYDILFEYGRYVSSKKFKRITGTVSTELLSTVIKQIKVAFDFSLNVQEESDTSSTKNVFETLFTKYFTFAVNNIRKTNKPREQIVQFLNDIGLSDDLIIVEAFMSGLTLKKVTLEGIIFDLSDKLNISHDIVRFVIREKTEEWRESHPEISTKIRAISITQIIRCYKHLIQS